MGALPAIGLLLAAAVPKVSYDVEVSSGSWRPLSFSDIGQTVEHAALEVLTRPGLIQLERQQKGADPKDYHLRVRAHLLDEAETHTVYLEIGPGMQSDLPSLNASHTVSLSKKSRAKMLTAIEGSARKAAGRLLEALKGPLAQVRRARGAEPPDDPFQDDDPPAFRWAPVRIPKANMGRASKDLYSRNRDLRKAALRELTSLALTDPAPRHVLERCVLDHFDKETRHGCLIALRPLARRIEPTRRVVIEAYRKDDYDRVRREAEEQMLYFTGQAKAEAIQALVESAAKGKVPGPLKNLGDVPNLDAAIRSCLKGAKGALDARPQMSCVGLVEPLPHRRRVAVLWRFLKETNQDSPYWLRGAGESENRIGTPWASAIKAVLQKAPAWNPKLGDLLWRRYQRTLSYSALDILAGYATPSETHAKRMLEVVQTAGGRSALFSLKRIGKEEAKLRPMIVEKLSELLALGTYPKSIRKRELERAIEELSE